MHTTWMMGMSVEELGKIQLWVEAVSSNDTVNLTVSNMDAERIRDAEKKFGVLTNCKVLVLLK